MLVSTTVRYKTYGMNMQRFGISLWHIFDYIILLGMGSIYLRHFKYFFDGCDHSDHSKERVRKLKLWRKEQQDECDRLATMVKH